MLVKRLANRLIGISWSRVIHSTPLNCGEDQREKRAGHKEKTDKLEGESGVPINTNAVKPFEYIDADLMETFIDNMKFKDIPVIYIKCTRNNTKMTISHGDGIVMATKTTGTEGYKNCRKGTTVAAQAVANRIVSVTRDLNVNIARLVFNGLGPGRGAAYKVLEMSGIKIVSLSDRTEAIEPWIKRPRKAKRL